MTLESGARNSALSLIGNTPLLCLERAYPGPGRIFAKAEFVQPGGSIKDRAALAIIEGARARGALHPGQHVVAMTSGNFGAGLAVVCNVLGHPLTITMSAGNSPQRAQMLHALGADVVLVPQVDGSSGQVTGADLDAATSAAVDLVQERKAFYVDQFQDENSVRAHAEGTAPELWRQLDGRIDAFAACVGSGGTFIGVAQFLKERRPGLLCAAIEPAGAEVLAGRIPSRSRHILQGTGYGAVPPCWIPKLMDVSIGITDDEATEWRHRLARQEGLHVGYSAAANVCAAAKLLRSGRLNREAVVATILCDTGLKY